MRNDGARVCLDRHSTYIVAAYLAGAAPSSPLPLRQCGLLEWALTGAPHRR